MRTLTIGISDYDRVKARTLAIARGEHTPPKDEPKVWFTSLDSFAKLLSETMWQYGLVELRQGERGTLVPRVPYDHVRLDVSLTGSASEGVGAGR